MLARQGFMTGQGYVIGLALVDATGAPLIGVMGVPTEDTSPPIMAAVAGHGLTWWGAEGSEQVAYDPPAPEWVDVPNPPWLISPQSAFGACAPFGADHPPDVICCGASKISASRHIEPRPLTPPCWRPPHGAAECGHACDTLPPHTRAVVKYFATAAGRACGFVQYEQELKSWDHACGVLCVIESGGYATDAERAPVRFADRTFHVSGGIVCASRWASDEARARLLQSADTCEVPAGAADE